MTTRPYRKEWSISEITGHFRNSRGTLFDPALVDIFLANIERFIAIAENLKDEESMDLESVSESGFYGGFA
jgi:putative two-component system response regulator